MRQFVNLYLIALQEADRLVEDRRADRDEVCDAVQTIGVRLYNQGSEAWGSIADANAYFRRALARELLAAARTRSKLVGLSAAITIELHARASSPEDECMKKDSQRRVREAIASLPERCRAVAMCVVLEGLTHSETGNRLGIGVKAVEKQMARARRILAAVLADAGRGTTQRTEGQEPEAGGEESFAAS